MRSTFVHKSIKEYNCSSKKQHRIAFALGLALALMGFMVC